MAQCPNGHQSEADDYCDTCGMPMDAPASSPPGAAVGSGSAASRSAGRGSVGGGSAGDGADTDAAANQVCPNCQAENSAEALFCEACGYDFTTGTMPRTQAANPFTLDPPTSGDEDAGDHADDAESTPKSFSFVAEQWIDPAWYELQESPDPLPSAGLPEIVPLRKDSLLIGRPSDSRNIAPDIDCDPDSGVSRRHAQLTTDGTRWWVEDLDSSNGTFVADVAASLPEEPIPVGQKVEVQPGERIYVGGWTRLVIRRATEDEQATL